MLIIRDQNFNQLIVGDRVKCWGQWRGQIHSILGDGQLVVVPSRGQTMYPLSTEVVLYQRGPGRPAEHIVPKPQFEITFRRERKRLGI